MKGREMDARSGSPNLAAEGVRTGADPGGPEMNALTPGGRYDDAAAVTTVRVAVLTISDTRTAADDTSGDLLAQRVTGEGHTLGARAIVPDDIETIRAQVKAWTTSRAVDVIVTTGGTGITG